MGESGLREKGKSVALSRIKPSSFHSKRRNATVELSSFIRVGQYKSPLRVVAGILLRSRETQAERARQKSEEIEGLRQFIQQQQRDLNKAHEERAEMKRRIAQLEIENDGLRPQPPVLPHDPVLTNHEFGPKMSKVCFAVRPINWPVFWRRCR